MYEHEQIEEDEAKNLADELNAIFQKTSAKASHGIEDLFVKIGERFLNPKGEVNPKGQGNQSQSGTKGNKKENIKINSKFNIKTPKNKTQIKLGLVYNKQFSQNINIKSRKSNTSLSLNMKKSAAFQNNNVPVENKKKKVHIQNLKHTH